MIPNDKLYGSECSSQMKLVARRGERDKNKIHFVAGEFLEILPILLLWVCEMMLSR